MRLGLTLPQFRADPEEALAVAGDAEDAGLDGVFVFDHLWPLGRPDRPALHGPSLLAALAVATERLHVGTLVARVGVVPEHVLVRGLATVAAMAGPRLIAGLGIGDAGSRPENAAYGVPFAPVAERRAALAATCRRLTALGVTTWVGGRSAGTLAVGRAEAGAVNLWDAGPAVLAAQPPGTAVTWGGQMALEEPGVPERLAALAEAGVTWAVVAPVRTEWRRAAGLVRSAARSLR